MAYSRAGSKFRASGSSTVCSLVIGEGGLEQVKAVAFEQAAKGDFTDLLDYW